MDASTPKTQLSLNRLFLIKLHNLSLHHLVAETDPGGNGPWSPLAPTDPVSFGGKESTFFFLFSAALHHFSLKD